MQANLSFATNVQESNSAYTQDQCWTTEFRQQKTTRFQPANCKTSATQHTIQTARDAPMFAVDRAQLAPDANSTLSNFQSCEPQQCKVSIYFLRGRTLAGHKLSKDSLFDQLILGHLSELNSFSVYEVSPTHQHPQEDERSDTKFRLASAAFGALAPITDSREARPKRLAATPLPAQTELQAAFRLTSGAGRDCTHCCFCL